MLVVYNTLSNRKEPFEPLEPGKVRMYVCGITVYDLCHVGHARMMVVFDVICRYLRASGYDVTYVRNITDIDDKIINRAAELGVETPALTQRFIDAMHQDFAELGLLAPDVEPRATEYIARIVEMIAVLVDKGLAYQEREGADVYYSVSAFADYGKLSGKRPAELRAGSRVAVDEAKRDPLDFVLWKAAKPGEPQWPSPWGAGRPGWHIECSAMSTALLGDTFDIHGGGRDLQFPHHENEIAQSEGCSGRSFVRYWLHNGFVDVNDEKMSKSLGNFFTLRDVLQHFRGEEIRMFIVASHYRSPLNYAESNLAEARAALTRLYTALRGLGPAPAGAPEPGDYEARFRAAMDDDFNTPNALAVLFELARDLNRARDNDDEALANGLGALLRRLGAVLGLLQREAEDYLSGDGEHGLASERIEALVAERAAARAGRDWQRADAIRAELLAAGVVLEDGAGGTAWRRK